MKTKFYLHNYVNKDNEKQIFYSVIINRERERLPTGYYCNDKDWNEIQQRTKSNPDLNLILDNMEAKTTEIRTFFRLTNKELHLERFLKEFFAKTPSYDLISFMTNTMNIKVTNANTLKKHKSVIKKLADYQSKISFSEIDHEFFDKYRRHLFNIGNNKTTRNSNIKIIKYYLRDAQKKGVQFGFSLDDLEVGSTSGNRTSVSPEDTIRLYKIYTLNVLTDSEQLALGYFLIACFVSLRISDIMKLKRSQLQGNKISITTVKGDKPISLVLPENAKKVIRHNPNLFVKFITQQKINAYLKDIAKRFKINKKLTMHVGRHTFATNYIKAGGRAEDLQIILGHSSLETTMIYVHLDREDAIQTVSIMDEFLKL